MKPLSLLILLFPALVFSQGNGAQVIPMNTASQIDSIISNFMLGGCVQVTNVQYTGVPEATGVFIDTSNSLGMQYGVALTTGFAANMLGVADDFANMNHSMSGSPLLDSLIEVLTFDLCQVEFDFIPNGDTVFIADFIFGSEEYPEYVNSGFNDIFGFFLEGPSISGPLNVAWIPGTNTPISIDNVNGTNNSAYYIDNANGTILAYDGYTSPIYLSFPVLAGETYHLTIAIADAFDSNFDSGVIIRSQSLCTELWFQIADFTTELQADSMTVNFYNLSQLADDFIWDFGDGTFSTDVNPTHTYALNDNYDVTLTASNGCFDTTVTYTINAGLSATGIEDALESANINWSMNGSMLDGQSRFSYTSDRVTNVALSIYDLQGKVLSDKTYGRIVQVNDTFDFTELPRGIYVAQLRAGNEFQSQKFVR